MILPVNVNKMIRAAAVLTGILIMIAAAVGFFFFRSNAETDKTVIRESAYSFICEITNRDYRLMTGREGYGFFSADLLKRAEKGEDAQKTKRKYEKEKIVQKIADKPEVYVEIRNRDSAEALVYYNEVLASTSVERRIFAVLYYKRIKNGKWKIDDYQFERY